jgi:hypothetical protein
VHAVGTQALSECGILFDQAGEIVTMHQVDEARGPIFVERRFLSAKQYASRIGGGHRLRELRGKRRRRMRWELKIEPAAMLDFGHHQRVSAALLALTRR